MEWSRQQDAALKGVAAWYERHNSPVYRLFGYAGTGKTTLATHLADTIGGNVMFGAYTGKAAQVMRTKGCHGASTIHQLIYLPRDKSRARLHELENQLAHLEDDAPERVVVMGKLRVERERLRQPAFSLNQDSGIRDADLVVIDEVSMVDGRIGEDLLSFGVPLLVLGDPAQLPPVKGGGFFTKVDHPDTLLTEVHRQASDNPIIHMATETRQKRRLSVGSYGESLVTAERRSPDEMLAADQVLVGLNRTRRAANARFRELLFHEGVYPNPGEKLVCLRNDHDIGLLNGSLWEVLAVSDHMWDESLCMTIRSSDSPEMELDVLAHTDPFEGRDINMPWFARSEKQEFDYSYTLTCHKAQGSQWSSVVVIDESSSFRGDRWRWLYTAITRAADKLTVVQR